MTDDDAASRWSVLGLGGLASLCCLGPGAAAIGGGATASALGVGLLQVGVTALTLALVAAVVRRRVGCRTCNEPVDT
ncbi:hypothetical protein [Salinibaculum rarum]|uniref:hypothetical protein n=1 Tax=Salinibaculum rarum TaxID=3058903 RepID=UPI00265EA56D|nr:hypothetical protein [Salinibaculum sp. KK48]